MGVASKLARIDAILFSPQGNGGFKQAGTTTWHGNGE